MGMKIMDTMRMTTVSPRPGRKKSMNFRLPGRTIRVLVPLPTGVRNGADAATQMAMATAVVFMPNACTMGMNNGVTSMAQEVFIMALVSRVTRTRIVGMFAEQVYRCIGDQGAGTAFAHACGDSAHAGHDK